LQFFKHSVGLGFSTVAGMAVTMSENSPHPQPTDLEMAGLSSAVYDLPGTKGADPEAWERDTKDWELVESKDHKSGFKAAVFHHKERDEYVIAFAGTENLTDWKANIVQGVGKNSEQHQQAVRLAQKYSDMSGSKVTLTGHSLGGGLATIASAVTRRPAVVFNPAGVHDNTFERFDTDREDFREKAEAGLVRSYVVEGEVLDRANGISSPRKAMWSLAKGVSDQLGGSEFIDNKYNASRDSTMTPPAYGARITLPNQGRGAFSAHRIGSVRDSMLKSGLFPNPEMAVEAVQEAAAQPFNGAQPSPASLAATAQFSDSRQRQAAMAAAFCNTPADQAIRAFPELASAYKALEAVGMKAAGMNPRAQDRIMSAMQNNLGKRIEQGKAIPTPRQAIKMVANALGGHER